MYHLKKRFDSPNDKDYKEEYRKFIKDMIDNGYAEKAPDDDTWNLAWHSTSIIMEQDIQKRKNWE